MDTSNLMVTAASNKYIPETVGVMIGADLMERFRVAGLNAAGQRRTITILFADLSGFTALSRQLDTEEVFLIIQQYMNVLIKDVYKFDGMVDKMLGDGLMAIFGAPIAHENHPELALRAASEMMRDAREFSYQIHERYGEKLGEETQISMHIALHSGEVIVGGIGTNMLMNYTAIGDTVNLASRLLNVAEPGQILVSQPVYQRLKTIMEFRAAGPFWLKGYDKPVSAYQFIQLLETESSDRALKMRSPMIGRDTQMQMILDLVQQVKTSRQGHLGIVFGEAGIGKSRLMTEFRSELNERNIVSVTAHSYTYKKSIQFWVLQDLVKHFLNITGSESVPELNKIAVNHTQPSGNYSHEETAALLLWLLDLLPKSEFSKNRFSYLDPEQLQREIFTLVRDIIFRQAGDAPLVLIFEDLHWADDSSLQFLHFLSRSLKDNPVLILASTRSINDEVFVSLIDVYQTELVNRFQLIELPRLSREDAHNLIDNLLEPNDLPRKLIQRIIDLGNGNPYFIEELIRSLIEQNAIVFDQTWRMAADPRGIQNFNIPDTLQGLILSRFDRLSAAQRRLLQVASIIGRDFNSNILRDVLRIGDPSFLDDILADLVKRGILEHYSDFRGQDFRFTHILMSDTIYGTLLSGDKSELHGMVAHTIEKLFPNHLEEQVDVLARHYLYSNDSQKALEYCILAGKQSADKYAITQALKYFHNAEMLMASIPHQNLQACEVYMGQGSIQVFRGEYQEALDSYRKAANRLQESVCGREDFQRLAQIHRFIAEIFEKLGYYQDAMDNISFAQNLVRLNGTSDAVEPIHQLNDLGWIQFRQGDLKGAETSFMQALQHLEVNTQPALFATLCQRLASVYFQQSRFGEAVELLQRSIGFREEIGDKVTVARSSYNLGILQWKLGDSDEAVTSFQRSLQGHQALGDVEGELEVLSNLGRLLVERGEYAKAEEILRQALKQSSILNLTNQAAMICIHLAKMYSLTERYDRALECTATGEELFETIRSYEAMPELKAIEGETWLLRGDTVQATKCADRSLEFADLLSENTHTTNAHGRVYRLQGMIACQQDDLNRASDLLSLSDKIFQHTGDVLEQGRNLAFRATLATKCGDTPRAHTFKTRAKQIFEQYGARADLLQMKKCARSSLL